ncbi:MAG: hypothetical protein J0I43_02595 [Microbacterium sp.]|uniref:hypothetical protein n=1 Tax=Microbacterium sp. TaxID=51671 RepID=UPI001ACCC5D4|nr:hypothetical protein [Microbacterium sp.]MBN9176246.1 hypothetical protein [Microbacterium sp.]
MALTVAFLGGGVVLLPWQTITRAEESVVRDVADGRSVVVIGGSGASVGSDECDALRKVSAVRSAGAILGQAASALRPTVVDVTAGLPALQWPSSSTLPVNVAVGVGQVDIGLSTGRTSSTLPRIDFFATTRGRIPALDSAVVVTSLRVQTVSECYVEATPGAEQAVALYATSMLTSSAATQAIPLRTGPTSGIEAQAEIDASPHLILVVIASALVVLIGCGSAWSRRHEQAVYQQLGITTLEVMTMSIVDWVLVVITPTAIGATTALALIGSSTSAQAFCYSLLCLGMFVAGTLLMPIAQTALSFSLGRANAGKL